MKKSKVLQSFLEQSNISTEELHMTEDIEESIKKESEKLDMMAQLKAQSKQNELKNNYKKNMKITTQLKDNELNQKTEVSEHFKNIDHSLSKNRWNNLKYQGKDAREFDEPQYDEQGRIIIDL